MANTRDNNSNILFSIRRTLDNVSIINSIALPQPQEKIYTQKKLEVIWTVESDISHDKITFNKKNHTLLSACTNYERLYERKRTLCNW